MGCSWCSKRARPLFKLSHECPRSIATRLHHKSKWSKMLSVRYINMLQHEWVSTQTITNQKEKVPTTTIPISILPMTTGGVNSTWCWWCSSWWRGLVACLAWTCAGRCVTQEICSFAIKKNLAHSCAYCWFSCVYCWFSCAFLRGHFWDTISKMINQIHNVNKQENQHFAQENQEL